jgi:mannosyltransferase OCH1-like enzyme
LVLYINKQELFVNQADVKNEIKKYYNENITNIIDGPFPNTTPKGIVIPLNIFQTWKTKDLKPDMTEMVEKLKEINPEFTHYLYDNDDCRKFIEKYFDKDVLTAFDCIIPGAYKADLWRYCILYIYGGIYLDIKYVPINGFKLINLVGGEHYALDPIGSWTPDNYGLFNAIIISKPNNPVLKQAIDIVVNNVKNKYYGINKLEPTGPIVLGKSYSLINNNFNKNIINLFLLCISDNNLKIIYKNRIIFVMHNEYRTIQKQTGDTYYANLWVNKAIYNDCF